MKTATIRMTSDTVTEILIYDMIGRDFFGDGIDAKEFRQQLKNVKADTINLRINSPGGSTVEAAAMLAALDEHPATIEVDVDGLAASAASLLAMSGERIRMSESALLMVHNPYMVTMGDENDHRRGAELLATVKKQMLDRYERRVSPKSTRSQIAAYLDAETWFSAADAVAAGFADEVSSGKRVAACASPELLAKLGYKRVPTAKLSPWTPEDWEATERRRLALLRLTAGKV